jgi:hypothetical protein
MQTWTYETSPIAWDYKQDRSFGAIIVGPVGSGKSVPSMQRIEDLAREQAPSQDGIARSRFAVIRNTMPELRATTAMTYQTIYPPEAYGEIIWRSPATHMMRLPGTPGKNAGVEAEINLIALDKPKDVKKLLSLELTGAFANEIRELPRAVINRLTERVGRYMLNERPSTWSGFWGDTNPPDADHWLYAWHHKERPEGYTFFHQPPGVLEVKPFRGGVEITDENFPAYAGIRLTSAEVLIWYRGRVRRVDCPVEAIKAADRHWIVNPWMENLAALSRVDVGNNPLGPRSYYGRALGGKTLEEIQSYLQGVYTFVSDGRRVVPQYNGQVHGVDHIPILEDEPIFGGMDIGGGTLQPSAILFQRHPRGPYLLHKEVVCFDMGVKRFGELIAETLQRCFPKHVERGLIGKFWGDPAGEKRDEIFETASFDFLRQAHGMNCEAAPSQDPKMRIAAISTPCERMIDGRPGILVNKAGCPTLHRGLMGAWSFKRLQISGENRYADSPTKNDESHICDATGYGLLGAGEFLHLGGRSRDHGGTSQADGAFDVFAPWGG